VAGMANSGCNAAANRRLGQLELSIGEYEDALKHLELAYESTSWDNGTRLMLGEAMLVNGRNDEGRALWADVNNAQEQLQTRVFWYKYIGDDERRAQIRKGIKK
jgi:predicted negative regulator of RcsB-dependent stress response